MRLYEINAEIDALLSAVDPETGELTVDMEALEALEMERDAKLENLALAVKNYASDIAALKAEENALAERRTSLEKQMKRAKDYLERNLNGEKFSTPRVAVTYRKTEAVAIGDELAFFKWAAEHTDFVRFEAPKPDKTAIKTALKAGEEVPGAVLEQRTSMSVR